MDNNLTTENILKEEEDSYLLRLKQIHHFNSNKEMFQINEFYKSPSFWQILNVARKEDYHSEFIAYYLHPDNHHSIGNNFMKYFMELIVMRGLEQKKITNNQIAHSFLLHPDLQIFKVEREEHIKNKNHKGRLDICIEGSIVIDKKTNTTQPFSVIIENKINASETKNHGKGQTSIYRDHVIQNKKDQINYLVILSPANTDIEAKQDFIQITYQDLLNHVIEPSLSHPNLNETDRERLKDYIKCLSSPALEEVPKNSNKPRKTTILAMSETEKKLLIDFWESNQDLIKACFNAIGNSDDGEFPDDAIEIAKKASEAIFTRDLTKYKIGDDGTPLSKRDAVAKFIELWGKNQNNNITIKDLRAAFPASLRGSGNSQTEIIYEKFDCPAWEDTKNYHKILIHDKEYFVAYNIWNKDRFKLFFDNACKLGQNDPKLVIKPV